MKDYCVNWEGLYPPYWVVVHMVETKKGGASGCRLKNNFNKKSSNRDCTHICVELKRHLRVPDLTGGVREVDHPCHGCVIRLVFQMHCVHRPAMMEEYQNETWKANSNPGEGRWHHTHVTRFLSQQAVNGMTAALLCQASYYGTNAENIWEEVRGVVMRGSCMGQDV